MPSSGFNLSYTFGAQPGPIPLSQLDTSYNTLLGGLNSLQSFSNYFVDSSGAANAITVTVPSPLTTSYTAGLPLQVKVANTNTSTAVTLNVNGGGAKAVILPSGALPAPGALIAGGVYNLIYDGTSFQLLGAVPFQSAAVYTTVGRNRTSNAFLDDPDLIVPVAAGTYIVKSFIRVQGITAGAGFDFRYFLTAAVVGGSSNYSTYSGVLNNVAVGPALSGTFTASNVFVSVNTAGGTDYIITEGVVSLSGAGNLSFQWAPNTVTAGGTSVFDRSWMRVSRIA